MICTNYYMNINELKEKYTKAHEAYLKHKDTNGTNNIEAQFIPEALNWLKKIRPTSTFIVNNDNFMNYLGIDIFEITADGSVFSIDLKICIHCKNDEVLCDGWKHTGNTFYKATDVKINYMFLFINEDNYILLPFKSVANNIPPNEECFYMRRDLYKTTSKFILDTKPYRRRIKDYRGERKYEH